MSDLRLLPAVFDDVAEAARWYDEEGHPGLGDRFVDVFYFYVRHIQEHGNSYRPLYREFRRVLLNPFPFATYYRYHGDLIIVSLVIHTARNPRLLRKILRDRQSETEE